MDDVRKAAEGLAEIKRRQAIIRDRIRNGLCESGKKLRRNATCPCGSGLKFKACCLKNMRARVDARSTPYRNARIDRAKGALKNESNFETGPEQPEIQESS